MYVEYRATNWTFHSIRFKDCLSQSISYIKTYKAKLRKLLLQEGDGCIKLYRKLRRCAKVYPIKSKKGNLLNLFHKEMFINYPNNFGTEFLKLDKTYQ